MHAPAKKDAFMNTPIHDFLINYAEKNAVRCHMPGGKGLNNPFDITEIDGADSLFEADGIIHRSESIAASLFGAGATLYSCGGSTLAIQGILGTVKQLTSKNTIVAGRYSHKSLLTSCILLGFDIKWAYPDEYLSAVISPEEIERLIDSDTAAFFLSSVDYYGGEADIAAISEVCRRHGVYLLVDNAHGAYKVFTENHPIAVGADMTADSAHKTLPCLTGGAYLHLKNAELYATAKSVMGMFGSSSPSYLIMDSLDLCNRYISEKRSEALSAIENVKILKKQLTDKGYALRNSDAMRITIDAEAYGYNGCELAQLLRENGAECEMSDEKYVVLLFSVSQKEEDFEQLYTIMADIPRRTAAITEKHIILKPERVISAREAYFSRKATVKTTEAEGRICAGIHCPCPPCVPLVMTGERIDGECIRELERYGVTHIEICTDI